MIMLVLLAQVIASPPPRQASAPCHMSVASCARLKQLIEEDTEYIGTSTIVPQDYEPLYPDELYRHRPLEWGSYATEQRRQ